MSGDPWTTALGAQAAGILERTGSIEGTAAELARTGATDEEIRELFYPRLTAIERRLLDRAVRQAREDYAEGSFSEYVQLINAARAERGAGPREAAPEPAGPGEARPTGPEWLAIVNAYRTTDEHARGQLPTQAHTAEKWNGRSEDMLRRKLRELQVRRWADVHALVATEH